MHRKFLGNLFFIIFLNLIIKPFFIFGIDIQVQNMVGAESYGLYFTLLNLSLIFNMFLDVGITNYNMRNIAQHPITLNKHLGSFLGLKLVLIIPYLIITLAFAIIAGYNDEEIYLLSLFIFNQILISIILYMRSNFAGLHLFKLDAILSVLDRVLVILIMGSIIYGKVFTQYFSIELFIYVQTFSYLLTVIVGLILTIKKIGGFKLKINKIFSIAILKQSTPFALLILIMMIYTRIDAIMVERLLPNGKEQSGIYAQVFRLLDAVNMFAFLIAGILLPMFSRYLSEKINIKPLVKTAANLLIGIAIVTGVGLAVNSEFTISSIYKDNISEASSAFIWLILCFIPLSVSHVFGTLLTANNNLRLLNQLGIFGIFLNIALNFLFIPKMEAAGAAIATLITQSIIACGQLIVAFRIFKFNISWSLINKILTLIIVYYFTAWFFMDKYNNIWSFLMTFSLGLAYLFILKLLDFKEILSLIKFKTDNKS